MIKKMKSLDVLTLVCIISLVALILLSKATTPTYLFVVEVTILAIMFLTLVLNLRFKTKMQNNTINVLKAVSSDDFDEISRNISQNFGDDVSEEIEMLLQEVVGKNEGFKQVIELAKCIEKDDLSKFKLRDLDMDTQLKHSLRVFIRQKELVDSTHKINTEFLKKIKSNKFGEINIDDDNVAEQQLNAILKSFEIIDSNIKNTQVAFYEGDFNVEVETVDIEKDYLNITSKISTLLTSQKKSIINLYYAILMLEEFDHQEIISQSYKGNLVHNFRALETVYENLTVSIENIAYAIEHKVNISYDNVSEIFRPIIDIINRDEAFANDLPEKLQEESDDEFLEVKKEFSEKILNSKNSYETKHFTKNHELILDIENRLKDMLVVFDDSSDNISENSSENSTGDIAENTAQKVAQNDDENVEIDDVQITNNLETETHETEIQEIEIQETEIKIQEIEEAELQEHELQDIESVKVETEESETEESEIKELEVEELEIEEPQKEELEAEELETEKSETEEQGTETKNTENQDSKNQDSENQDSEDIVLENIENSNVEVETVELETLEPETLELEETESVEVELDHSMEMLDAVNNTSINNEEPLINEFNTEINVPDNKEQVVEHHVNINKVVEKEIKKAENTFTSQTENTKNSRNTLDNNSYNNNSSFGKNNNLKENNKANKLDRAKKNTRTNVISASNKPNENKGGRRVSSIASDRSNSRNNTKKPLTYQEAIKSGEIDKIKAENNARKRIEPIRSRSEKEPVTYQQFLKDAGNKNRTTDNAKPTVTQTVSKPAVEVKPRTSKFTPRETVKKEVDSVKNRSKLVENLGRELNQRERAELDLYGEILDDKTRAKMDLITSGTDLAGF